MCFKSNKNEYWLSGTPKTYKKCIFLHVLCDYKIKLFVQRTWYVLKSPALFNKPLCGENGWIFENLCVLHRVNVINKMYRHNFYMSSVVWSWKFNNCVHMLKPYFVVLHIVIILRYCPKKTDKYSPRYTHSLKKRTSYPQFRSINRSLRLFIHRRLSKLSNKAWAIRYRSKKKPKESDK
jgi:hypothetical protein